MTLAALRKLAVKKRLRIRFVLPNGLEGAMDEHGVARVPALNKVPDFDLESELPKVKEYTLEYRAELDKKGMPRRESLAASAMEAMTKAAAGGAAAADHEEE